MNFSDILLHFIVPIAAMLFWLFVYFYDCIKNDKLPSVIYHIKTYWWIYILCIMAVVLFLISLTDKRLR